MNITWHINNGLRALGSACALAWLSAIPVSAEEPYVHWAKILAGESYSWVSIGVTGDGGLLYYRANGAVSKFNPQGELVNTSILTGAELSGGATDALGNQYWIGAVYTNGTFDFPTVQGFFVAKFGPTNNLLWVRNNELPEDPLNYASPTCISVDSAGNIAVGGITQGRLKLGSFESDGDRGPFFCKYDANGNLLWARKVARQHTSQYPYDDCDDIALDGAGNVIAGGMLSEGSADFGGTTVYPGWVHGYGGDGFIAKYNSNGELLWVTLDYAQSLAVDKHGDIYVAFQWPLQAVNGIAKLNGNGDLLWQKNLPANFMHGMALDEQGQPVFAGMFEGTVQFDAITLRSRGDSDFFVAKADVAGSVLWAIAGGGPGYDRPHYARAVACDSAGNVFLTAEINVGVNFNPANFDGISIVPIPTGITPVVARLSERPPMQMARSAAGVQLSWPAKATNYVLEASGSPSGTNWGPANLNSTLSGRNRKAEIDSTIAASRFFRLRKP